MTLDGRTLYSGVGGSGYAGSAVLMNMALSVMIVTTPLGLWRVLYPLSDWAVLSLAPLVIVLFVGFRRPLAQVSRAKAMAVVRSSSPLSMLATGGVSATVRSTLFVASAIFVLAWQSLDADAGTALVLLGICAMASTMTVFVPRAAARHFRTPVARHYGIALGASAVAILFLPVLAWFNWSSVEYPGELRLLGFREAVSFWLGERLPERRGWIAEILAWAYAVEALQVSFLARSGFGSVWALIYAVYLGLVGFLVARSSAAVSFLVQEFLLDHSPGRTPKEDAPDDAATPLRSGSKTASRAFWATIATLVVATMGAAIIGNVGGEKQKAVEATETRLEGILSESADAALKRVAQEAESLLAHVYEPVYRAIPAFADFHYSVVGEYTELGLSIAGGLEKRLHSELFNGFDERLEAATDQLERHFVAAYKSALDKQTRKLLAAEPPGAFLGEATRIALTDAVERAGVTAPVAGAASLLGSGGLKALTAGVAKKLAAKIAAKAAAKAALKGGVSLAGAETGAIVCSWAGPIAVACGAIGAVTAWLLADAAIIHVDEIFNRDEFEAELRGLVDEHKASVKRSLEQELQSDAKDMDRMKEKVVADFRLRDL